MERPTATSRERFAWCLFDFANSAFNTIVVTFVFVTYFAEVVATDGSRGDVWWSWSLVAAGLAVAIVSPVLGDFADRTAHKKTFLVTASTVCIVCTALLTFPAIENDAPGLPFAGMLAVLAVFTVANIAFEIAFVFYNAYLPGLGDASTLGRLSGKGWAFGYAGGLLCLTLCLWCVGLPDSGIDPLVSTSAHLNVRVTGLIVAAWFAVFALPMFFWVRDHTGGVRVAGATWRDSLRAVGRTVRQLPQHPNLLRFFIARLFYNDATLALIGLAGLYMKQTLGMATADIMVMAIWLNVVAGVGAFGFGYVDDFVGARVAVIGSLILLLAGGILAIAVPTEGAFTVAATLVGLGLGPNQAASRSLLARLIDPVKSAQFYGLYALSGKATAWVGPLLFGIIVDATGNQRVALTPLIAMFGVGLWLLWRVDERRSEAA